MVLCNLHQPPLKRDFFEQGGSMRLLRLLDNGTIFDPMAEKPVNKNPKEKEKNDFKMKENLGKRKNPEDFKVLLGNNPSLVFYLLLGGVKNPDDNFHFGLLERTFLHERLVGWTETTMNSVLQEDVCKSLPPYIASYSMEEFCQLLADCMEREVILFVRAGYSYLEYRYKPTAKKIWSAPVIWRFCLDLFY